MSQDWALTPETPAPPAPNARRPRPRWDDADWKPSDDGTTPVEWSSLPRAERGPEPLPVWLITEPGAFDQDLGVLKTGKEADVHVVRRTLPADPALGQTGRSHLLAAKHYRSAEKRLFHRDASYLEGRRVRRSREMRAMATRTDFGKELIAGQWAWWEWGTLTQLWADGYPVPYPVTLSGTSLLMEFCGSDDGVAAPRLAQTTPDDDLLEHLWEQVRDVVLRLARTGRAHGDLSPYNALVDGNRLVVIDWPQVVDVVGNPQGMGFLHHDCVTMADWFRSRGLAVDGEELFAEALGSL